MWWLSSSGEIELNITKNQAEIGYHTGSCDAGIEELLMLLPIKKQLNNIDPKIIAKELRETGGWEDSELQDHEQNKRRLLWLACGDIEDETMEKLLCKEEKRQ